MLTKITNEFYIDFAEISYVHKIDGELKIYFKNSNSVTITIDHDQRFTKSLDWYLGCDKF